MSIAEAPGGQPPRLELTHISKSFPGCLANDEIDLTVMPGEIHALLGENGAGKSTLVKIVYGLLRPDAGEIKWEGAPQVINSPAHARALGIGMVFQHFSLFDTLTVAENVALGINDRSSIRVLSRRIEQVSESYGLAVDPARLVFDLSVAERQRVEILRCLLQAPKLIIMDEPTSVLTPQEAETLFETLRRLAEEGRSILYISHKLQEIRALCARATILRAGRVVATCDPRTESAAHLAELMIGTKLHVLKRPSTATVGPALLIVTALDVAADGPFGTAVDNVSFTVGQGEILGIAGVAGNGQRELMHALTGEAPAAPAAIKIGDLPVGNLGPRARRSLGMAVVPDERLGHGSVPEMNLAENALLTGYRQPGLIDRGLIRFAPVHRFADAILGAFRVVGGGSRAEAKSLSGGNLQKFIMGREMMQRPRILVAASPTWGVDAGAAAAIHQSLLDLAREGTAVLIISQDLDELLAVCDRVAVIAGGKLSASMAAQDASPEVLGLLMAGAEPERRAAS